MLTKTVAKWMKGKSVEVIREKFNIPCDDTPEDDERLKKENQWAEDAVIAVKKAADSYFWRRFLDN